jgi:GNAT superfamily N-acetyltransferase
MDGWLLRFTDGFTHRGNSVAPLAIPADTDAALASAERASAARGLAPMVQMSPAAQPGDLASRLEARGYAGTTPTFTMVADIGAAVAALPESGDSLADGGADFEALVREGSRSVADGDERLDIFARLAVPKIAATALAEGQGVACGTGTCVGAWVNINLMRTRADRRREGHARRVLAAIARWGKGQGATGLFLNVEEPNHGARALYRSAGFRDVYRSLYCRR